MLSKPDILVIRNTYCIRTLKVPIPCMYMQELNSVIIVPADVLAPNGARSSASTVLTKHLDMSSSKFFRLSVILCKVFGLDDIIQNGQQDLSKSLAIQCERQW